MTKIITRLLSKTIDRRLHGLARCLLQRSPCFSDWKKNLAGGLGLTVVRINRCDHEADIEALKKDLDTFAAMVRKFESQLRIKAASNVEMLRMAA